MTDDPKPAETSRDEDAADVAADAIAEEESPALAALLKRSLSTDEDEGQAAAKERELVTNVQRKLRHRSKGKFYADGWSTTQSRLNYALVAAIMFITIVAVYFALGPMGVTLH
jgi:hypothetical protein